MNTATRITLGSATLRLLQVVQDVEELKADLTLASYDMPRDAHDGTSPCFDAAAALDRIRRQLRRVASRLERKLWDMANDGLDIAEADEPNVLAFEAPETTRRRA